MCFVLKTRLGVIAVFRALLVCIDGASLTASASQLFDVIERSLVVNDKDGSNLRIEALLLLRNALQLQLAEL